MTDGRNDLIGKIKYLKEVKGLTFRQIEAEAGIPRKRASKIYSGVLPMIEKRGFLLDPYRDLITSWLQDIPSLKAIQIWHRLKERGIAVSYRATAEYTLEWRKKKKGKVYWPLTFLPGEEGQVDWFFAAHPCLGKLAGFALVLSYSRYVFAHLIPRSSFEFFIEGHLLAFERFEGTPRALRYDNLKSVVLKREPLTYNPAFLEFARYYGFEIRLCNPASGNEKGRVERLIRSIRETFLNTADHHQSLQAVNEALHQWTFQKNQTVHRATDRIPAEAKKEETLKALPAKPWNNVRVHPPQSPTKTGFMIFDTNLYSVPEYKAHGPLSLHSSTDRVEIYDAKGNRVACHPRSFGRKKEIANPLHRSGKYLSKKGKRDRIHAVIKNMDPEMEKFLEQNTHAGEDPYQSAYVFFTLLKEHSRGLLLSLVREAVEQKCCRMKWILSRLNLSSTQTEAVSPQNAALLAIDYKPRPLEDYDVKNK